MKSLIKPKQKRVTSGIYLPEDINKQIIRVAARYKISKSSAMVQLITVGLKQLEAKHDGE